MIDYCYVVNACGLWRWTQKVAVLDEQPQLSKLTHWRLQLLRQLLVVSSKHYCHCVTNVLMLLTSHSATCCCKVKGLCGCWECVSNFHLKHHRGYKLNLLSGKTTEDLHTENREMQKRCRPLCHLGKCGGDAARQREDKNHCLCCHAIYPWLT